MAKKSRSAKVKDGIINLFLRSYLIDRYTAHVGTENKVVYCDLASSTVVMVFEGLVQGLEGKKRKKI
jgi:hypothetical protein